MVALSAVLLELASQFEVYLLDVFFDLFYVVVVFADEQLVEVDSRFLLLWHQDCVSPTGIDLIAGNVDYLGFLVAIKLFVAKAFAPILLYYHFLRNIHDRDIQAGVVYYCVALSTLEIVAMLVRLLVILEVLVAILRSSSRRVLGLVVQGREPIGGRVSESVKLGVADALELFENREIVLFVEHLVIKPHLPLDSPENVVDFVLDVSERSGHAVSDVDVQEIIAFQEYFEMRSFALLNDLLLEVPSLNERLKVLSQLIEIGGFQAQRHDDREVGRLVVADLVLLVLVIGDRLGHQACQGIKSEIMVNLPDVELEILKLEQHERDASVSLLLREIVEHAITELKLNALNLDLNTLAILPEELWHIDVHLSAFHIVN